ncbi:hypothetical protein BDN71DRAFT_1505079 [Pleurotus eryngii]|uniref:Uncharacterized protein n=1 Tax=Pleurotus eryngii TaxID=5323 RepID=A0A9P6A0K6_PLEER|nr:hypothetical protein BDN71DRAFT_1505079 [Pleurotus eryngii]
MAQDWTSRFRGRRTQSQSQPLLLCAVRISAFRSSLSSTSLRPIEVTITGFLEAGEFLSFLVRSSVLMLILHGQSIYISRNSPFSKLQVAPVEPTRPSAAKQD